MSIEELLQEFMLQDQTYKVLENNERFHLLAKNDEFWSKLFEKDFEIIPLIEYFSTQSDNLKKDYVKFAISCFHWFIQLNFTGPPLTQDIQQFLYQEKFKNKIIETRLCVLNNEDINVNCQYPILLGAAHTIFNSCIVHDVVNFWWGCRALMVHQEILDELCPAILTNIEKMYRLIPTNDLQDHMKVQLYEEIAQVYIKFRYINKAQHHINLAQNILGISYELTGKLGRRMRHQDKDIAQLALEIKLMRPNSWLKQEIAEFQVPANIQLKDDDRLDRIEYSEGNNEPSSQRILTLGNLDQKLLLIIFLEKMIATPMDELKGEELLPFLDIILSERNTYAVHTVALFYRCKLEAEDRRAVERCVQQCEELIDSLKREQPNALNRVGDVYGTAFPPYWKMKAHFAEVLLNIGLIKQSLDIYLELKLWEEVIVCYTLLNMKQKAIDLLNTLLEENRTVKMLCLLGDATEDIKYYEEAWELSKKRSHRVQRHWGLHYYDRQKYKEAIPHFERTLSINPLQVNIWIRLGFAALQVENWPTAATAYRRYTNLEPNGFEAWNNLAQAYIKMGNQRSAHQALCEALKCNFENWKVWENFLLVSCDISNWNDVIRSYHRLLDLKEKYLNTEALTILVENIKTEKDGVDENAEPNIIMRKSRELLGRILSIYPTSGNVWELYAKLSPQMLCTQRLQRAFRCYAATPWENNKNSCKHILSLCNTMADMALDDTVDGRNTIVRSIKLNVASALAAAQMKNYDDLKEIILKTTEKLELLNKKIAKTPPFSVDNC